MEHILSLYKCIRVFTSRDVDICDLNQVVDDDGENVATENRSQLFQRCNIGGVHLNLDEVIKYWKD